MLMTSWHSTRSKSPSESVRSTFVASPAVEKVKVGVTPENWSNDPAVFDKTKDHAKPE